MKDTVLIVLLVLALALLVLGIANHGVSVAFDYIVGTWHVSLGWLLVIVAGLVVVTGLGATLAADLRSADQRRALEGELQSTYARLRQAQAALPAAPAATDAETAPVSGGGSAGEAAPAGTGAIVAGAETSTPADESDDGGAAEAAPPAHDAQV